MSPRVATTVLFGNEALFKDGHGGPARARLAAIHAAVDGAALPGVEWRIPRAATRVELERVHDPAYLAHLEHLRGLAPHAYEVRSILPGSLAPVLLAAGAGIEGVELLLSGKARHVFCAVEPPGHHAERSRGMGFCAVNNVAVAAHHALELGCERVLVVDWDVHHGNGTQHAFEERRDVLFFDCHQEGIFPESGHSSEAGRGEGAGYTVNVPLPAGLGDADYAAVFKQILEPVADRYRPDLVLVSAGFDAHGDDPLGGMQLSAGGFAWMCAVVRRIAERHAGGRLMLMLEGGYDAAAVGDSARRCVEVLAGRRAKRVAGEPQAACLAAVEAARRIAGLPSSPGRRRAGSRARARPSLTLADR